jgi:thiol-disulfide isomerase/thioredoxin
MRWNFGIVLLAALAVVPSRAAAQFDSGIPVGSKAPIVSIHDLDGKPVDLGGYIGKRPVLIEFWATWCALCKALLPELGRVHQKYGDQVAMIGVNITVNDSKERVRRYLEAHKPPYLALFDDQGVGSRAFDVATTSFIVVIDKTGKVVYTGSGGDQDLVAAVGKAVGR